MKVSTVLPLFLAGCGALPVGVAPTDGGGEGCRPPLYEPYYVGRVRVYSESDPAFYDEERIKRCEQFYNEAERRRKEALAQDLDKHMSPNQPQGDDELTESSLLIKQGSTDFD